MSKRFKKIALAIYLDPAQKGPDSFTYDTMVNWSQKRKEYAADPNASIELHQLVHIHKDIYLSGLFLHQLKPELAKSLALSLSGESINETVLFEVLKSHQIVKNEPIKVDQEELFESINTAISTSLSSSKLQSSDVGNDRLSYDIENLLTNKLSEQLKLINELKQIVSKQNKLIDQLINQNAQSSEDKTLAEGNGEIVSTQKVEKRLANVQKLKKKGVF